jgi:hypothetical protein
MRSVEADAVEALSSIGRAAVEQRRQLAVASDGFGARVRLAFMSRFVMLV